MKASENNFGFIEQESLIEIPFFQRAYVWDDVQWEQLFNDLVDSFNNKKEHFLGSVVLKQLNSSAGEGSRRSLIDGQQRLTTFSILVKSLYDYLDQEDKDDYKKYLYRLPLKERKPKISHSRLDKKQFNKVLSAKSYEELDSSDIDSNDNKITRCYEYFSKMIQNLNEKQKFLSFILNSKLWVTINLDSNEDEQKIFDSINTSGLKLTASDIIKNAIFAKAISIHDDYENLYKTYWEAIFESEDRKFWEQEVTSGNVKRVQSEIFLHAFAIIQGFFKDKDTLENLSSLYKEKIKDFKKQDLEKFLETTKEFAILYKNLPQIRNDMPLSFENSKNRLFHILKISDTNTIMPLILALQYNLQQNKNELESCLNFLEIFILTRYVCSKKTEGYNKLFAEIARNLAEKLKQNSALKYLEDALLNKNLESATIPAKAEIIQSLKKINNRKAKLILFWIELYRRYKDSSKYDITELSYIYTLEHLCPIRWEDNWSNVIDNEQQAAEYIYQIGNMTLLKGSLNIQISNASWSIKLDGDGSKKNCIKKCADLSISKELLDTKEWNPSTIQERTDRLTKEFFMIWEVKN